jgi:catechol 2,3-dioxygenase-like lactoylglutathione lyase family enzyme
MKVKRIEHVAIAVKSMAQSRKIFEEKLGFKLEYEEYLPQYSTRLAMYPIGSTYIECSNPIATTLKPRVGLPNAARACFTSASKSRELKKPSRSSEERASSCSTSARGSGMRIRALLLSTRNQPEMS